MIPVEPTPDTVLVPVVAAWLAGLAGAELGAARRPACCSGCVPAGAALRRRALRGRPERRTAARPTVAGRRRAALGAGRGSPAATPGDDPTADRDPPRRARRCAGCALAARGRSGWPRVVGLVAVARPVRRRPGRRPTPVDPRRYVEPPQVDSLDENPLIRISGWALHPDQRLLDVSRRPARGRRRCGCGSRCCSDYDGVTWRVGATTATPAGCCRPRPPLAAPRSTTVRQRDHRRRADRPAAAGRGDARRVDGARVAYDPATGTLIRPEGLTPGAALRRSPPRAERPDLNLLPAADVPVRRRGRPVPRGRRGVPDRMRTARRPAAAEGNGAAVPAGARRSRSSSPSTTGRWPTRRAGTPTRTWSSSCSGRANGGGQAGHLGAVRGGVRACSAG